MATSAHVQLKLTLRHYEILQQAMQLAVDSAQTKMDNIKDEQLRIPLDTPEFRESEEALTLACQELASLEMLKSTLRG